MFCAICVLIQEFKRKDALKKKYLRRARHIYKYGRFVMFDKNEFKEVCSALL